LRGTQAKAICTCKFVNIVYGNLNDNKKNLEKEICTSILLKREYQSFLQKLSNVSSKGMAFIALAIGGKTFGKVIKFYC